MLHIISLITVLSLNAMANSSATSLIETTYSPTITYQIIDSSLSLYGCRIEDVRVSGMDPITKQPRGITLRFYKNRKNQNNKQAIIILPPTGGINILDKGYANEFCWNNLNTAIITEWEHNSYMKLDLGVHNSTALRALTATRHVVEFLKQNHYSEIGILGTSIGAISSTLALEFEPRISTAVLITGSARFANVIAESDESSATQIRNQRMKEFNFSSTQDYKNALQQAITLEPSNFTANLKTKKALIITADSDTTVPTVYQHELATAFASAWHIPLEGNHIDVIKKAFCFYRKDIKDFFIKNLTAEPATESSNR